MGEGLGVSEVGGATAKIRPCGLEEPSLTRKVAYGRHAGERFRVGRRGGKGVGEQKAVRMVVCWRVWGWA